MKLKKDSFQKVTSIITALNSETKMIIVHTIKHLKNPVNVNKLVEITGFERTNVSKQLKDLVAVGILIIKQRGRERFYEFDISLSSYKREMIDSIIKAYEHCDCSNGKLVKNKNCCK